MTDPLARIDAWRLDPDFLQRLRGMLGAVAAHGQTFVASYGYRSLEQQQALYVVYKRGGPRAAPPGKSAHNFGLAVDLVRLTDGKVDWTPADYALLAELAPRYGLTTGASYADYGHVELDGWEKVAPAVTVS